MIECPVLTVAGSGDSLQFIDRQLREHAASLRIMDKRALGILERSTVGRADAYDLNLGSLRRELLRGAQRFRRVLEPIGQHDDAGMAAAGLAQQLSCLRERRSQVVAGFRH